MSERAGPATDRLSLPGKLALLAALYVAQGLPFGFFTQTLPALMRTRGYRLTEISYAALLNLPWALKFLWAPLVDRYPAPVPGVRARRTRWIISCQLIAAMVFAILALRATLEPLAPLFVAFGLLNLVSATQDIATDGLAVDILGPAERGYANGVQVAGYRAGMVIGGGVLLVVLGTIGPRVAFAFLAGATVLLSVPLFLVREAPAAHVSLHASSAPGPHFLRLRGVGAVLAIVVTYKLAESLVAGVLRPFVIDRGFSLAELGAISGLGGSTGGLLGALSGGTLASRLGRKPALVAAGVFQTLTVFLFAIASVQPFGRTLLAGVCFIEAFASSMATAALFTVMMDWCRPRSGATDYTVQASAVVIATGLTSILSGRLADALGYTRHFIAAGLFGVGSIVLLLAIYPHAPPAEPPSPAPSPD